MRRDTRRRTAPSFHDQPQEVSMGTRRMAGIPSFGIDRVVPIAGEDPAVLRLENLDTDLRPAEAVPRAAQTAVDGEANS
jgi:hypothetical protein